MPYERIGEAYGSNGIAVPFRYCRALGIELKWSVFGGYYQDILGKRAVKSVLYLFQGKIGARLEISDLARGMHTRIGPARTRQLYLAPGYSFERRFDLFLDRSGILLELPPRVMSSVIAYDKFYITR